MPLSGIMALQINLIWAGSCYHPQPAKENKKKEETAINKLNVYRFL